MTALHAESTETEKTEFKPIVRAMFEQEDIEAIASLYFNVADLLAGSIRVAPKHKRGRADWAAVKEMHFTKPERDDSPDTFEEIERWFVLVEHVDGCRPEASFALYFDPLSRGNDAPVILQLTGPKIDATIGRAVIYRELGWEDSWGWNSVLAETQSGPRPANDNSEPVDLWQRRAHPPLPAGLLPPVIEEFARAQGELMGVDAGGLAAAALAVCAAAIPDSIKLKVKRHDPHWLESARIWVAPIGDPSTKKSPLIAAAAAPLKRLDRELFRTYEQARRKYDAQSPSDKKDAPPPKHVRLRLEDTTIEAAQEVLKDSPDGVLCLQDELSGWFGSMDKYSSGRGAAKDRGFWLQAFNGGPYTINRIGRGAVLIDNLSVSLLGGIQPEPIRALAAEAHDDGLLQRLFPIVLGAAGAGVDKPMPDAAAAYDALVTRLTRLRRPTGDGSLSSFVEVPLQFDDAAQDLRSTLAQRCFEMQCAWESVNKKLASHLGKYDGLFARLCIVFHCIESEGARPASIIKEDTAKRAAAFLEQFLFPHAVAFYVDVLGMADRHDRVLATAGYILAHKMDTVTIRDVRRGDRVMRGMDNDEAKAVLEQLDALGWLEPVPSIRRDSSTWQVLPSVHKLFADRAEVEKARREEVRRIIRDTVA
jgi:hypothetical protein